jgi:hypothetical protein
MNTGIERRPFKVLRPVKHSTAMVIARYSARIPAVIGGPEAQSGDLLWRALRVAGLCAACAFTFFLLSERNLLKRSGEVLPPAPVTAQRVHYGAQTVAPADAKALATVMEAPAFALPDGKNLKVTEFALSVSREFQDLGDIQVRLMALNSASGSYDITVRTNEREFYRQDVKVNEHLALAKNPRNSAEIVVAAIAQNRVFGYLSEPRRHSRRHRRSHT